MRGRVVKVADGYATYSQNVQAAKCGGCPVRNRFGICGVRAEHVAANRLCYRYGHQRIRSAKVLANNKKNRKENQ